MRKLIIYMLLLIMTFSAYGCQKNKDGIVATVNQIEIEEEEYELEFKVFKSLYERQLGEGTLSSETDQAGVTLENRLRKDILEKLIIEKLIIEDSEKNGILVSEEEVKDMLSILEESVGGKEAFEEFLKANEIPRDYFKKTTEVEMITERHREFFIENQDTSREDARAYYQEYKEDLIVIRARHILVSNEEDGRAILEKLKAGEEFEVLAMRESIDSRSGINGGDLGYFSKGTMMIKDFEDVAFSLEEGEISDLVASEVGYHIIRVDDRKDSFEDLEEEINMILIEENYSLYIEALRDSADIQRYLNID